MIPEVTKSVSRPERCQPDHTIGAPGNYLGPFVTRGKVPYDVAGSVPPERAACAAALSETSAEFAFAFGIAALGSRGTAVYHIQLVGWRDQVRGSLAGAVAFADTQPGPVGATILFAARQAFTDRMHVVGATGGLVLVVVAVVALTAHRPARTQPIAPTPQAAELAAG